MSTFMQCEPCGKSFTGRVCYDQHIESDKHKRKILSFSIVNSASGAYVQPASTVSQIPQSNNVIECSVCNVVFDSFMNFQTHSLSPEHAQKVMEKNSANNPAVGIVSSSSSSLNYEACNTNENISVDENDKILPAIDMCKSQTLSFSTCNVCKKNFSGPEPYKQHMESAVHKKKVQLLTNASATGTNPIFMTFSCNSCKKIFSGQVPYVQHMNSEIHKKKVQSLQYLEKPSSEVDSPSGTKAPNGDKCNLKEKNPNLPWFCTVCEIQCSGLAPYKQHLDGVTHLKNMAKAQKEKCNSNSEDYIQRVPQQCSNEGKNILNGSHLVNGTNLQLNKSNQNLQVDSLLPELVNNLHEVSTEELEESIKIFLPDDEIDFDSKINTDSADVTKEIEGEAKEEFRNDQGCNENYICGNLEGMQVDEIKEKFDGFEMCNLCNVKLSNKEEAMNHYEILEHFSRRWKSN